MCYWCCFRQKYGRTVPARRDSRTSRSSRRDSRRWSIFTIFLKDVPTPNMIERFDYGILMHFIFRRLVHTYWTLLGSWASQKTDRRLMKNFQIYQWSQWNQTNCHRVLKRKIVTPMSYQCQKREFYWTRVVLDWIQTT